MELGHSLHPALGKRMTLPYSWHNVCLSVRPLHGGQKRKPFFYAPD